MFLVLLTTIQAHGQINEFKNKILTARLYADTPTYKFTIENTFNSTNVVWAPNIRALTGVDVSINGFISVGYGWANNDDPGSAQKKGVTEYTDYRVTYTPRWLRLEANYQRYKGFYLENTSQIATGYAPGFHMLDANMVGGNISLNATIVSSPEKFSYTAAINQDARQESSGGSWLWGLNFSDTYFSSDSFLIPSQVRSQFGDDKNVISLHFNSLTLKGGYGYTIAWSKKVFTSLLLNVGLGGTYRVIKDSIGQTYSIGNAVKSDAVISFGFNGDDFLIAIIATGDMTAFTTNSLKIPAAIGDAKLAIGWHF
ncbi:MAG: DUF4421 family protein [Oligoflexia bacterium]|nr:DUF4421 family protein [Oligoflexia bacterium]